MFLFCLHACFLSCFIFLFACLPNFLKHMLLLFSLLFCLLVYVRRLVSHETMYDSKDKEGKVQEDLYGYQHLVIYCPLSLCRTCCLQSMIHIWKIRYVRSESW